MKDKYPHLTKEALQQAADEGLSMAQARRKLKVPRGVIWFRVKRFGIKFTNERVLVTGKQVELIKETYLSGLSIVNTAKKLDLSYDIVCDVIKQNNLGRKIKDPLYRKYQIKYDYFSKIDTEEKAYFLGLIYTDGNVMGKRYCLSLGLHSDDFYMVERFAKAIYLDHTNIPFYRHKKQKLIRIDVRHKGMFYDMLKLGVHPRKSFTIQFPTEDQVPSHLLRHFIRGVLDGDGCVHLSKRVRTKKLQFSIFTCSQVFAQKIQEFLIFQNIKTQIRTYKMSSGNDMHVVNTCKKETLYKLFRLLYDEATIFLDRKRSKFIDFFQVAK